jgi:hypothetical protein
MHTTTHILHLLITPPSMTPKAAGILWKTCALPPIRRPAESWPNIHVTLKPVTLKLTRPHNTIRQAVSHGSLFWSHLFPEALVETNNSTRISQYTSFWVCPLAYLCRWEEKNFGKRIWVKVRCHWEHPWGAHSELQEQRGEHLEMLGTSLKIDGNMIRIQEF